MSKVLIVTNQEQTYTHLWANNEPVLLSDLDPVLHHRLYVLNSHLRQSAAIQLARLMMPLRGEPGPLYRILSLSGLAPDVIHVFRDDCTVKRFYTDEAGRWLYRNRNFVTYYDISNQFIKVS